MKKILSRNKKIHLEYKILYELEVGLCLRGQDVKYLRKNNINFTNIYATIINNEIFIKNMVIDKNIIALLHKKQIMKIKDIIFKTNKAIKINEIYDSNGKIKANLLVVESINKHDKRIQIMKKENKKYEIYN